MGDCIIPLTKGYQTVVDEIDADLAQYKWSASGRNNYAARNDNGGTQYMHRAIMERSIHTPIPEGWEIDHIDGDPRNNRRRNLRLVTRKQSQRYKGRYRNNRSGYKGVSWNKQRQKYECALFLGLFDTPEEAYAMYCNAANLVFGEFARLK